MNWLRRLLGAPPSTAKRRDQVPLDSGNVPYEPFVCSTCGRTDLPEAGGWNPPICQECDAAINFDALEETAEDEDG